MLLLFLAGQERQAARDEKGRAFESVSSTVVEIYVDGLRETPSIYVVLLCLLMLTVTCNMLYTPPPAVLCCLCSPPPACACCLLCLPVCTPPALAAWTTGDPGVPGAIAGCATTSGSTMLIFPFLAE